MGYIGFFFRVYVGVIPLRGAPSVNVCYILQQRTSSTEICSKSLQGRKLNLDPNGPDTAGTASGPFPCGIETLEEN